MIITCSACKKRYKFDERKIPSGVKDATCKACGQTMPLKSVSLSSPNSPSNVVRSCPKCSHPLEGKKQDECPNCGIILSKYKTMMARKREEEKRKKIQEEKRKAREEKERKANLINCVTCKKEVSLNATTCPHCGEPLTEEPSKEKKRTDKDRKSLQGCSGCLVLIIGGFVLILISSMFTSNKSAKQSTKSYQSASRTATEKVTNSGWDGSVYQVKTYLKTNLKDPDSFEAIEWSPVKKTDDGYIVRCKYRAKNSFGGYIIENQIFILNKNGKVISVVEN